MRLFADFHSLPNPERQQKRQSAFGLPGVIYKKINSFLRGFQRMIEDVHKQGMLPVLFHRLRYVRSCGIPKF